MCGLYVRARSNIAQGLDPWAWGRGSKFGCSEPRCASTIALKRVHNTDDPEIAIQMKASLSDTSPNAYRMWIQAIRGTCPSERLARARSLSQSVIELSRRAIARAHPEWDETEVGLFFVELHYGKPLARQVRAYLGGAGK